MITHGKTFRDNPFFDITFDSELYQSKSQAQCQLAYTSDNGLWLLYHLILTMIGTNSSLLLHNPNFKLLQWYRTLTRFWPPPTPFLAPYNQGRLLVYGRNGQSICLLSPFFSPSSKIAQPKYAKGASERARSASVYGSWFFGGENHCDHFLSPYLIITFTFK